MLLKANFIHGPQINGGISGRDAELFLRGLPLRIGLRDPWPRFAQAQAQLAKQPLTLTCLPNHAELLFEIARVGLAIPNTPAGYAGFTGTLAQHDLDLRQLSRRQT